MTHRRMSRLRLAARGPTPGPGTHLRKFRVASIVALATGIGPVLFGLGPTPARSDEADVVAARGLCSATSVCRFRVTVRHDDEGWDHYADRWEVLAADGTVLGTRVLRHPHVEEQPFTRGLGGVEVPDGTRRVRIRARDSVHGFGGREIEIELRRAPGTSPESPEGREATDEETPE